MRKMPVVLALLIIVAGSLTTTSKMDIDYSHNVVGIGTVITDYRMESQQSTEASGKVRGSGELSNKYIFLSSNDSDNVTIEDRFVFSRLASHRISLSDYPQKQGKTNKFRMLGTDWAKGLNISVSGDSENQSGLIHVETEESLTDKDVDLQELLGNNTLGLSNTLAINPSILDPEEYQDLNMEKNLPMNS